MPLLFSYHTKATSSVRKLLNGTEVPENDTPVDLIVHTKAPSKWKLVDMETGQEYVGSIEINQYGHWIRVKDRS